MFRDFLFISLNSLPGHLEEKEKEMLSRRPELVEGLPNSINVHEITTGFDKLSKKTNPPTRIKKPGEHYYWRASKKTLVIVIEFRPTNLFDITLDENVEGRMKGIFPAKRTKQSLLKGGRGNDALD